MPFSFCLWKSFSLPKGVGTCHVNATISPFTLTVTEMDMALHIIPSIKQGIAKHPALSTARLSLDPATLLHQLRPFSRFLLNLPEGLLLRCLKRRAHCAMRLRQGWIDILVQTAWKGAPRGGLQVVSTPFRHQSCSPSSSWTRGPSIICQKKNVPQAKLRAGTHAKHTRR